MHTHRVVFFLNYSWSGSHIRWGQPFRLRHLSTGHYLGQTEDQGLILLDREKSDTTATAFCFRPSKVWTIYFNPDFSFQFLFRLINFMPQIKSTEPVTFLPYILLLFQLLNDSERNWSYMCKTLTTVCITNSHLSQTVHNTCKSHSKQHSSQNRLSAVKHMHNPHWDNTHCHSEHTKLNLLDCSPASQCSDSVIATSVSQLLILDALLLCIGVSLALLCCYKQRGHKTSCSAFYFISIKLSHDHMTVSWHSNGRTGAICLSLRRKRLTLAQSVILMVWGLQRSNMVIRSASLCTCPRACGCPTKRLMQNLLAWDHWREGWVIVSLCFFVLRGWNYHRAPSPSHMYMIAMTLNDTHTSFMTSCAVSNDPIKDYGAHRMV